jgi:hypothetical protein
MSERWWEDDEDLMAVVLDALREERATPARVADAGMAAFTWRSVDAELAALTYDSLTASVAAETRAERAAIREVTFVARAVTIHVQLSGTAVHGQIVPPQRGRLELQVRTRAGQQVDIDEQGWFSVEPVPGPAFRLVVQLATGHPVYTDWLQV